MSETAIGQLKKLYRMAARSRQEPARFEVTQALFDALWSEVWARSPEARCPCKRSLIAAGCGLCGGTGRLPEQPLPDGAVLTMGGIPVHVVENPAFTGSLSIVMRQEEDTEDDDTYDV